MPYPLAVFIQGYYFVLHRNESSLSFFGRARHACMLYSRHLLYAGIRGRFLPKASSNEDSIELN